MDGTLTQSVHDFDAMRAELGIASGSPILEALNALPEKQAAPLWARLDEMELYYAKQAKPMPGSVSFLQALQARGACMGILTRNALPMAIHTLRVCGMLDFFEKQDILDRDAALPKPNADGVLKLMHRWQSSADDAVMVGDYGFDLQAGRNAGVATIHIDPSGQFSWPDLADLAVRDFTELSL